MARFELKVGLKFKPTETTTSGDVTVGKVYEIAGTDDLGWLYFIDDAGDRNFAMMHGGQLYPYNSAALFVVV